MRIEDVVLESGYALILKTSFTGRLGIVYKLPLGIIQLSDKKSRNIAALLYNEAKNGGQLTGINLENEHSNPWTTSSNFRLACGDEFSLPVGLVGATLGQTTPIVVPDCGKCYLVEEVLGRYGFVVDLKEVGLCRSMIQEKVLGERQVNRKITPTIRYSLENGVKVVMPSCTSFENVQYTPRISGLESRQFR